MGSLSQRFRCGAAPGNGWPTVWDFETDPEYQAKLDWVEKFMVEELEPLDLVALDPYDKKNAEMMAVLRPLQQQVKDQGLWAAHLTPELGGQGFGQVKLALLNEILGRSRWAPSVFGCQAPDSGNAEILALFGTDEQKARYLQPLLDGEITSCYSMTEPQGGSDPGMFVTSRDPRRRRLGDQRREVVFQQRQARVVLHRHGRHQSRRPHLRQDVAVHRSGRDAGHRDHPQRRRGRRVSQARSATATSATTTSGCRPITCSAVRARRS